jgi:hypothetical protein
MTKGTLTVNEALEDVRDSVDKVKCAIADYQSGTADKGFLAAVEKEMRINNVLENLHLHMVKLCLQDKDVAEVLVKVKLIKKKDLTMLADKNEESRLQIALNELSAALEEARALLARPAEFGRASI